MRGESQELRVERIEGSGVMGYGFGMQGVSCPSCGEEFEVAVPPLEECPARLDYDCEVCCRPMVIVIDEDGRAEALGTGESYSL